jgi:hypothetical protein
MECIVHLPFTAEGEPITSEFIDRNHPRYIGNRPGKEDSYSLWSVFIRATAAA